MATVITDECINCGACEPECPNTAIYQGGVEYDFAEGTHDAISADYFYIVPEKCTECVGFFDQEACAAVCPVDCCIPDPARPETEEVLLVRAKEIHPDKEFGSEYPSRFKGQQPGEATTAAGAGTPGQAAAAAAKPVAAAPAAAVSTPAAAGPARVEKALPRKPLKLSQGDPSGAFADEMNLDFDDALARVSEPVKSVSSRATGLLLLLASPFLGALGDSTKRDIERAHGDERHFSNQGSTGLNVFVNFFLYPILAYGAGVASGLTPFTEADRGWIFIGVLIALVETTVRLRESLFKGIPVAESKLGAALYGAPLSLPLAPIARRLARRSSSGRVPVEGFYAEEFEAKRERERRYGDVYDVQEYDRGYLIRFELARIVPPSSAKEEMGIGDEMPDYGIDVSVNSEAVTIRGSVVDPRLRAVCGISSAFPTEFKTEISLDGPLGGFRHRYSDKLLEVVVLKQSA